jgi:hypothetical protein
VSRELDCLCFYQENDYFMNDKFKTEASNEMKIHAGSQISLPTTVKAVLDS